MYMHVSHRILLLIHSICIPSIASSHAPDRRKRMRLVLPMWEQVFDRAARAVHELLEHERVVKLLLVLEQKDLIGRQKKVMMWMRIPSIADPKRIQMLLGWNFAKLIDQAGADDVATAVTVIVATGVATKLGRSWEVRLAARPLLVHRPALSIGVDEVGRSSSYGHAATHLVSSSQQQCSKARHLPFCKRQNDVKTFRPHTL
jgi:hypothetical protein